MNIKLENFKSHSFHLYMIANIDSINHSYMQEIEKKEDIVVFNPEYVI